MEKYKCDNPKNLWKKLMRNTRCSAIVSLIGDGNFLIKIYLSHIQHMIIIRLWSEYLKSKFVK